MPSSVVPPVPPVGGSIIRMYYQSFIGVTIQLDSYLREYEAKEGLNDPDISFV